MSDRVSTIHVERGLYVLRYVKSSAGSDAPSVVVRVPERARGIEIISAPGAADGVLEGPGSCVVIRSERAGSVDAVVRSRRVGQDDAELSLDALVIGGDVLGERPTSVAAGPALEIIGHVSRRGDVRASAQQWVAGPDAPAPIEGVVVRFASAIAELGLSYQALLGGREPQWSDWVVDGAFAGSRGQHRPLLALRVRLTGRSAPAWTLAGEALFLGAPIRALTGSEIEFSSETGLDPLIGLKIAVIPVRTANNKADPVRADRARPAQEGGAGRVRVFRASGAR